MNTPIVPTAPDTTPPSAPTRADGDGGRRQPDQPELDGVDRQRRRWPATGSSVARGGLHRLRPGRPPGGTTFNDTGLAPSTAYRYRVRAADVAGNLSPYSTIATATTRRRPTRRRRRRRPGSTATPSARAGSTGLDGLDRQRRRDRLPGRAVPGHRLHQLRPGRNADHHGLQQHRAGGQHRLPLPGAGRRRRGQPESLLDHRDPPNARAPTPHRPTAPTGLTATAVEPDADQPGLDGVDRQRRRDRLPRRALPGRGLHELRPDRHRDDDQPQRHRPDYRRPPTATGCGRPTRRATSARYSTIATATTPAVPDTSPPTAPGRLTATAVGSGQVESRLDGVDRQCRGDGLSGGALPGRGVHQLRAGGDADGHVVQRHRSVCLDDLPLPGAGGRRRRQPQRLLERRRGHHRRRSADACRVWSGRGRSVRGPARPPPMPRATGTPARSPARPGRPRAATATR